MTTLLMSSRHSVDNQALWREAIRRNWSTARAKGIRVPEIEDDEIVIYAESLFAPILAESLGRTLLTPPEDWLVQLPETFTKRKIELVQLDVARTMPSPVFVKPPNEKTFTAQVYDSGQQLPTEFEDDMLVLVSSPVEWASEFRSFCIDGRVVATSPYLRDGVLARESSFEMTDEERKQATNFTESVLNLKACPVPRACVIDVGRLKTGEWAVVEANAAWGSGIYGCDPSAVLDVIRAATIQPSLQKQD